MRNLRDYEVQNLSADDAYGETVSDGDDYPAADMYDEPIPDVYGAPFPPPRPGIRQSLAGILQRLLHR
jgi:hypothetical protein